MRALTRLPGRGWAMLRDWESGGFLGVSLLVGVAVGLGALVLILSLEAVEAGVDALVGQAGGRWVVALTVPAGLLAAWWVARRFCPEVAGDGVPEAAAALSVRAGYLATKSIPLKILATALTLGGGGSGGREGPIVQIGGAIGSSISRRFGFGEEKVRSLVAAGAAAGIGASFNAPIAGMLFALEVILRSFAVRHMSAVVLASVAAAVTFGSLAPEQQVLRAGRYSLADPRELVLYAGLAMLAVVAAVGFLRLLDRVERVAARLPVPWLRPAGIGLAVGALVLVEPRLGGTGQPFVTQLLFYQQLEEVGQTFPEIAVGVLFLLAAGKIVATSLTIGAGASAGAFMPSLFIGAALGAGYAKLVEPVWSLSEIRPGAFAVVGMATVFAAVARAPLTAILIVFEVTGAGDYGLILPLMLSATFATFVADLIHPQSVYTLALERKGINLAPVGEVDLLDTVSVGEVMTTSFEAVRPEMPLAAAEKLMAARRRHGVPVVGEQGLVGILTLSDLARAEANAALTVGAAMTTRPVTVSPATPVSNALERMAVLGVGRLPVVAGDDPSRLVGMFRREDAVRAYHEALGAATGRHLDRERLRRRVEPDAAYYDFRVPPGSIADGRAVREVAWPEGSTLVSVRRGTEVLVPGGATVLAAGDVVTAFGSESSRRQTIERLNAGADEPTAEIEIGEIAAGEGAPPPQR